MNQIILKTLNDKIMPELPEVYIMKNFINNKVSDNYVYNIKEPLVYGKPILNHHDIIEINEMNNIKLNVTSRGKELCLTFYNNEIFYNINFTLGMSGNFYCFNDNNQTVKHERFSFLTDSGHKIDLIDPRRFAKWRIGQFNHKRSPDIYQYFEKYKEYINNYKGKKLDKRLIDTILDQTLFNGVGTYIASELINRSNFNPFATTYSFLRDSKNLDLLYEIINESYNLGGGNFHSWNNPNNIQKTKEQFENWTQFYRKKDKCFKIKTNNRWLWIKNKWLYLAKYSNYEIKNF